MNNLWVQTDDATGQHVQAIAGERAHIGSSTRLDWVKHGML